MSEICIIVPVYNRAGIMERCVKSIISQTFTDWTLLLVDDGSTDISGQICDAFAEKDARIQVLHKENGGVSSARNAGLDWAFAHDSSRWLSFIDSDDWVSPHYFEYLFDAAQKHGVDISCCNYVEASEDADSAAEGAESEVLETKVYWKRFPSPSVVPWGKIYRKSLFEQIRYPLGKVCDDTFTTHKILFQRDSVAWISDRLYFYYVSPDGISRDRNSRLWSHWSEAYEEQAAFFHSKSLIDLRNTALRRMCNCKADAIACARSKDDIQTTKRLKADLTRQLTWAQRDLGIRLYGNEYIYESVMPYRAAISRTWRHFKMRLRKLIVR